MTDEQAEKLIDAINRLVDVVQDQATAVNDISGSARGIFACLEKLADGKK